MTQKIIRGRGRSGYNDRIGICCTCTRAEYKEIGQMNLVQNDDNSMVVGESYETLSYAGILSAGLLTRASTNVRMTKNSTFIIKLFTP